MKIANLSRASIVGAVLALIAAGCESGQGSLSGEVTYEGAPVKEGYISFTPEDGKGMAAAGPIKDGKYSVDNIPPGAKVVKVEASSGATPSVQSSADMERMSKEMKGRVGPTGIISTETVPADAEGNNQKIDVKAGAQTLNFALKKPAGKK